MAHVGEEAALGTGFFDGALPAGPFFKQAAGKRERAHESHTCRSQFQGMVQPDLGDNPSLVSSQYQANAECEGGQPSQVTRCSVDVFPGTCGGGPKTKPKAAHNQPQSDIGEVPEDRKQVDQHNQASRKGQSGSQAW